MPRKNDLQQDRSDSSKLAVDQSNRWEEKRTRFTAHPSGHQTRRNRLNPSTVLAISGLVLITAIVGVTFLNSAKARSASAAPIQQVAATTAVTENGQVAISRDEVESRKLVAWNYKQGTITTPLLAYVTPSGAVKVATRMCEPCNSTSFRTEGDQLVCNACGSRWELETSKGIAGGCQSYPPEVLPSQVVDGKIVVDEQKVATWKPRV